MEHKRRALTTIAEDAVDQFIDLKRNAAIGQDSLFGGMDDDDSYSGMALEIPDLPEWEKSQLLALEREMLGLYVSDHPLLGLEHVLRASSDISIGELVAGDPPADGTIVKLCGLITGVQRRSTRSGDPWASIILEDLEGSAQVMVFPQAYNLSAPTLVQDNIVVVRARVKSNDEGIDLHAQEITVPAIDSSRADAPLVVSIPAPRCTPDVVASFKQILSTHPGTAEVHLRLVSKTGAKVMRVGANLRVSHSAALVSDLKELLGPNCVT